jgi:MATE family multidrug resistance protein
MFNKITARWNTSFGYKKILVVAFPLILSSGSWSLQNFVDRMFLSWYSSDAIAAAMPAGILNFTFMSFFIGTAGYVTTFVAHYHGAGRPEKIGAVIWQGVYLSIAGGAFIMMTMPFSDMFFSSIGHPSGVAVCESQYYFWLCLGAIPAIGASALSGFFSGLGKTWPVMWINIAQTGLNLFGDYILIFGHFGFPEMGIRGAAIATSLSAVFSCTMFAILVFSKKNNEKYRTRFSWRFNTKLIKRIIKFGAPSGTQFCLDTAGFAAFIILIGALGEIPLAASNIALSINTLAFMPMIGIGIAVSILVGHNMGARNPRNASYAAWSGFHITFVYMTLIACAYVIVPNLFLAPFLSTNSSQNAGAIMDIAVVLLRFVAVYTVFDSLNMIFGSALKGAGDTKFVMLTNILLTSCVLVIPSFILIRFFSADIFSVWYIASVYISVLGISFLLRFLSGRWKSMRVIEETHIPVSGGTHPEIPIIE